MTFIDNYYTIRDFGSIMEVKLVNFHFMLTLNIHFHFMLGSSLNIQLLSWFLRESSLLLTQMLLTMSHHYC